MIYIKDLIITNKIKTSNRVWMLHNINNEQISSLDKLNLKDDILIWDDGVLSQYNAIKFLKKCFHIIAISPAIVESASYQNIPKTYESISTSIAHMKYHENNDASLFMDWDDIKELSSMNNVTIALHGWNHKRIHHELSNSAINNFYFDVCCSIDAFYKNLSYYPSLWVWPYNDDIWWADSILKSDFDLLTIGKGRYDANRYFKIC